MDGPDRTTFGGSPVVQLLQIPEPGQIVRVRQRQYLVEEVVPPPRAADATLLRLSCLDDDAQGQPLAVIWEKEVDPGVADARHIEPVVALIVLVRRQRVLEALQGMQRTHPQRLLGCPQPHAAVESPLEDGNGPFGRLPDEEQLTGLVGNEGQADALPGQPAGKVARGGSF